MCCVLFWISSGTVVFSTFPAVEEAVPLKKWAGLLAQVTQTTKIDFELGLN